MTSTPRNETATPATRPSVLLVHGAFADGSSWREVAERLEGEGYRVTAAELELRGLSSDAAQVRALLDRQDGATVVVGHSYGGAVIGQAATGHAKAAALVHVAAFAPAKGESVGELDASFGDGESTLAITDARPLPANPDVPDEYNVELTIKKDAFRERFGADLAEDRAAAMNEAQRPTAAAVFGEPAAAPAWETLPSWYVVAGADLMIPVAGQRRMAERMGATVVEVPGAGHAVAVSRPDEVARVIVTAARTVVG
ncbi:alpha/beta fold hydrolase [Streptomyces jumonjinensis]|uniref:alpha/beta fold hydrolase n=1 Tax=Streptomyces jumonjinensis TaxID=1945 RepID=UPI0037B068DF